jgi:chaperonin cofactor prefoldin
LLYAAAAMAQPGVLMKVGGLLVKTLAKPVARQLKVDAEHVGWLREACTSIGQTTNYLTSRLTHASSLDKWKKPYKHIELKATEAREKGAEIVSEGFVLTVAVTVMGYEYNRQNNYKEAAARRKEEKEDMRRRDVEARLERLEAMLEELSRRPPVETKRRRWWS